MDRIRQKRRHRACDFGVTLLFLIPVVFLKVIRYLTEKNKRAEVPIGGARFPIKKSSSSPFADCSWDQITFGEGARSLLFRRRRPYTISTTLRMHDSIRFYPFRDLWSGHFVDQRWVKSAQVPVLCLETKTYWKLKFFLSWFIIFLQRIWLAKMVHSAMINSVIQLTNLRFQEQFRFLNDKDHSSGFRIQGPYSSH